MSEPKCPLRMSANAQDGNACYAWGDFAFEFLEHWPKRGFDAPPTLAHWQAVLFNPGMLRQSWREWVALITELWDDPL